MAGHPCGTQSHLLDHIGVLVRDDDIQRPHVLEHFFLGIPQQLGQIGIDVFETLILQDKDANLSSLHGGPEHGLLFRRRGLATGAPRTTDIIVGTFLFKCLFPDP